MNIIELGKNPRPRPLFIWFIVHLSTTQMQETNKNLNNKRRNGMVSEESGDSLYDSTAAAGKPSLNPGNDHSISR